MILMEGISGGLTKRRPTPVSPALEKFLEFLISFLKISRNLSAFSRNDTSTEMMVISGRDTQKLKLFMEHEQGNAGPQYEKEE